MDLSTNPNAPCKKTSGGWCWPHGKFCDDPDDEVTFDLVGCARCDGDGHPNLTFKKFKLPAGENDEWTHWATCPTTGEPILMGFFDIEEDEAEDESCDVCGNVFNKPYRGTAFCSFCVPIMIERGLAPACPTTDDLMTSPSVLSAEEDERFLEIMEQPGVVLADLPIPIIVDESVPVGEIRLTTCTCGVTAIKTWELVHAPSCPCS